jgi:hypothetical protein
MIVFCVMSKSTLHGLPLILSATDQALCALNTNYHRGKSTSFRLRKRHRHRALGGFLLDICSLEQALFQPGRITLYRLYVAFGFTATPASGTAEESLLLELQLHVHTSSLQACSLEHAALPHDTRRSADEAVIEKDLSSHFSLIPISV